MNIRKIEFDDIGACADILCGVYNNEVWQCNWEKEIAVEYLMDYYNMSKFIGYVIEDKEWVLGAIFAHEKVWWNNREVFIDEFFIKPKFQRKGYGSLLLKKIEEYVRQKNLAGITLSTNKYAPAFKFYKKNAFIDCEHILFMCKEIK